jgi:hypothetical protein
MSVIETVHLQGVDGQMHIAYEHGTLGSGQRYPRSAICWRSKDDCFLGKIESEKRVTS